LAYCGNYVPPARVAELAREKGIDFTLAPGDERQLRRAGADAALIKTLRELAQPKPIIRSFTAEPTSVAKGQAARLHWRVSNATSVMITGVGEARNLEDSISVYPTSSQSYTLYVRGPGGAETKVLMVEVRDESALPEPAPNATEVLGRAKQLYAAGDVVAAFALFWQAADLGNAEAMFSVGQSYENGSGVTHDYAEAMRWYRKASEAGDGRATNNVGWLYQNGSGVTQDYAEAMRWYRKAAAGGDGAGMNHLAWFYELGLGGVSADRNAAVVWWCQAAAVGNRDGIDNLKRLGIECAPAGEGTEITQSVNVAAPSAQLEPVIESFTAEPQRIEPGQQVNLRWSVGNADTVTIDPGIGRVEPSGLRILYPTEWTHYRLIARGPGGSKEAAVEIIVRSPVEVETPDLGHVTVYTYKSKSRNLEVGEGNGDKMNYRGIMLYFGQGADRRNYVEAMKWFRKAAAVGSSDGMFNIGWLYEHGEGVRKDRHYASLMYQRAAAAGNKDALSYLHEHPKIVGVKQ
jgi:uncharacterized protein